MYIIIICQVREAKYNSVGQVSTALMLIDDLGRQFHSGRGNPVQNACTQSSSGLAGF